MDKIIIENTKIIRAAKEFIEIERFVRFAVIRNECNDDKSDKMSYPRRSVIRKFELFIFSRDPAIRFWKNFKPSGVTSPLKL